MTLTQKQGIITISDGSQVRLLFVGGFLLIGAIVLFLIRQGAFLWNPTMAYDFVFFGTFIFFVLLFYVRADVTIDTAGRSLTYQAKRWTSSTARTIPLSSVTHIHLKSRVVYRATTSYQLRFSTANGQDSFQIENEFYMKNALNIFEHLKTVLPHAKFDTDSFISAYQSYKAPERRKNLWDGLRGVPYYSWISLALGPFIFIKGPKLSIWTQWTEGTIFWFFPFIIGGGILLLGIVSFLQSFYGDLTQAIMRIFQH